MKRSQEQIEAQRAFSYELRVRYEKHFGTESPPVMGHVKNALLNELRTNTGGSKGLATLMQGMGLSSDIVSDAGKFNNSLFELFNSLIDSFEASSKLCCIQPHYYAKSCDITHLFPR